MENYLQGEPSRREKFRIIDEKINEEIAELSALGKEAAVIIAYNRKDATISAAALINYIKAIRYNLGALDPQEVDRFWENKKERINAGENIVAYSAPGYSYESVADEIGEPHPLQIASEIAENIDRELKDIGALDPDTAVLVHYKKRDGSPDDHMQPVSSLIRHLEDYKYRATKYAYEWHLEGRLKVRERLLEYDVQAFTFKEYQEEEARKEQEKFEAMQALQPSKEDIREKAQELLSGAETSYEIEEIVDEIRDIQYGGGTDKQRETFKHWNHFHFEDLLGMLEEAYISAEDEYY